MPIGVLSSYNEEPNIKFFKILIGVTTCNIVVTL